MKKFENFKHALANLRDIYACEEPYSNIELAGCVQLYEVCFELAWKAIKEHLQAEGFPEGQTGSPKQTLKTAFEAGIVEDEQAWLDALADRNNVAHAYDPDVAKGIVESAKRVYIPLFEKLEQKLSSMA